jgi:hypothetical protein
MKPTKSKGSRGVAHPPMTASTQTSLHRYFTGRLLHHPWNFNDITKQVLLVYYPHLKLIEPSYLPLCLLVN